MASILRQIVAGPRAPHPEANLDLCYVTDNIIATSGPGATYPQVAYRNPLKDLVKFLDSKHDDQWAIWEFRAEGTGYPDEEVYGRVWHYPWPDHHPPPFALIPLIMGSMRNWLKAKDAPPNRVVVVHCKAGKGRSGTVACSYLISEEGWTPEDAMKRFSERRMRPGFGVGISIPSQQRWITYTDRWTRHGKLYVERPVEITEVHVWGLRDGVKIAVEGYVEEGKVIKKFHTFHKTEREVVGSAIKSENGFADVALEAMGRQRRTGTTAGPEEGEKNQDTSIADRSDGLDSDVIFRPASRVALPSSDINIDFERRNNSKLPGFTIVTSIAHVWFNAFFEGHGPEKNGIPDDSGVFEIEWDAMDGIKGSSRKGTRAFDKLAVVWKAIESIHEPSFTVKQPTEGQVVQQTEAADWRGEEEKLSDKLERNLGIREKGTDSAAVSQASSMKSQQNGTVPAHESDDELVGVKSHVDPHMNTGLPETTAAPMFNAAKASPTEAVPRIQIDGVSEPSSDVPHASTIDLPRGVDSAEMKDASEHTVGKFKKLGDPDFFS